jgi:hypothetical protein
MHGREFTKVNPSRLSSVLKLSRVISGTQKGDLSITRLHFFYSSVVQAKDGFVPKGAKPLRFSFLMVI